MPLKWNYPTDKKTNTHCKPRSISINRNGKEEVYNSFDELPDDIKELWGRSFNNETPFDPEEKLTEEIGKIEDPIVRQKVLEIKKKVDDGTYDGETGEVERQWIVDGKTYTSIVDIPDKEIRDVAFIKEKDPTWEPGKVLDVKTITNRTYEFNGKTYDNIKDIPDRKARQVFYDFMQQYSENETDDPDEPAPYQSLEYHCPRCQTDVTGKKGFLRMKCEHCGGKVEKT